MALMSSSDWQAAGAALVDDLQHVFAHRLRAVVAYGPRIEGDADAPLTCLALVDALTVLDLEGCARCAAAWEGAGVATPLLVPEDEFRRSLDVFPLEYGEIIRSHVRVFGDDPFTGLSIAPGDLRRACEAQVKSHLLHLREGFIEARGRPEAVADLVVASAPAFSALLRNVARVTGVTVTDRLDATRGGARAAGLPAGVVHDVLALEQPTGIPTVDPARIFPDYLAAVEQLAHAIDEWRHPHLDEDRPVHPQ
jgi:hypothetical protein